MKNQKRLRATSKKKLTAPLDQAAAGRQRLVREGKVPGAVIDLTDGPATFDQSLIVGAVVPMSEAIREAIALDVMPPQQGDRLLHLRRQHALATVGCGSLGQIARQADEKEIADGSPGQSARRVYCPN